jgi:hypothetical protein
LTVLDRFLEQIRSDVFDRANEAGNEGLRLLSLVEVLVERMEEAGVAAEGHVAYYRRESGNVNAEVHAYSYDTDDDVLTLYHCIDANEDSNLGDGWSVKPIGKDAIDRGFRRLEAFVRLARSRRVVGLDESEPAAELVKVIQDLSGPETTVELSVLTTGTVSERAAVFAASDGFRREVWDLLRLMRSCGGVGEERPSIDFTSDFGQTLPCLVMPRADDGIQVLLTSMPGKILADIYKTYRGRLLERNVRSFLQFTGKVNRGIRDTVLNSPDRFLAYNNGISATAASVDLEDLGDGLARIRAVRDFQVVNGGQTTASVASCLRRDGADLSLVDVPMKLTVVPPAALDDLVPLISKYANTQNRIQEADFSANHPWHIALERLSRAAWTRPTELAPRGTRWYYERSRGQYADEVAAQATPAGKRAFRRDNPSAQKFTKTDLAKFVLSWDQRPAVVSRGAQKCFVEFMNQLVREGRRPPDEDEFRRIIGQAILFHTAERLYADLEYQGYRAQVVTYSIARLSHTLQRRIRWDEIWEAQAVPASLVAPLKLVLTGVREVILHPPQNRNITEWCKREECWSAVLQLPLQLGLPGSPAGTGADPRKDQPPPTPEETTAIELVRAIPADVWFAAAKWAKDTESLQGWQRSLAYSLGTVGARGKTPSSKQAVQGCRLLTEARRLGFGHDLLVSDLLQRLANSGVRRA